MENKNILDNFKWTKDMICRHDELCAEKLKIEEERDEWLKKTYTRNSLLAIAILSVFLGGILTIILWIASIFIDPLNSLGWALFDFAGNFTDSKLCKYLLSIFVLPTLFISVIIFILGSLGFSKDKEDEKEDNFNKEKNDVLVKLNTSLDSITTEIEELLVDLFDNTIVEEELLNIKSLTYLINGIELGYADTYEEAVIYYKRQLIEEQKEEERRRHAEQLYEDYKRTVIEEQEKTRRQQKALADRAYEQQQKHQSELIDSINNYY